MSAVISLILLAISTACGSGAPACSAIIFVMSPSTLILPAMKAFGRRIVERHGEIGVLKRTEVHVHGAFGGVHERVEVAIGNISRYIGDDLVHAHDVGGRRQRPFGLFANALGFGNPFWGQELVLGHWDSPLLV